MESNRAYTNSNQHRPQSDTNLLLQLLHIIYITVPAQAPVPVQVPVLAPVDIAGYRQ
jgi:hypothetical protein